MSAIIPFSTNGDVTINADTNYFISVDGTLSSKPDNPFVFPESGKIDLMGVIYKPATVNDKLISSPLPEILTVNFAKANYVFSTGCHDEFTAQALGPSADFGLPSDKSWKFCPNFPFPGDLGQYFALTAQFGTFFRTIFVNKGDLISIRVLLLTLDLSRTLTGTISGSFTFSPYCTH